MVEGQSGERRVLALGKKLDGCEDFSEVFGLVKTAVERTMRKKRAGLILGLSYLPSHIGAFHKMGSNFIVMNKRLLEKIVETKNRILINSFVFHVLLHEYIHSLGIVDERETQALAYAVSEKSIGTSHMATQIARYGLGTLFAQLQGFGGRFEPEPAWSDEERPGYIEIVKDIDKENLDYFG